MTAVLPTTYGSGVPIQSRANHRLHPTGKMRRTAAASFTELELTLCGIAAQGQSYEVKTAFGSLSLTQLTVKNVVRRQTTDSRSHLKFIAHLFILRQVGA
jgi:hypothetical protein